MANIRIPIHAHRNVVDLSPPTSLLSVWFDLQCCLGGSDPMISPSPQEHTTSANNQPSAPNRLPRSHRCKQHTERYTPSFSCIRFICAMNISFGSRVSGAVVCPDERRESRGGERVGGVGAFGGCVVGNGVTPPFQALVSQGIRSLTSGASTRPWCIFLSPGSPKFFQSCLTLQRTRRLVVQPVQICFEFCLLPSCSYWA